MTPEDKMLNLLGLSLRAGKLITGEEMTIKSIQKNKSLACPQYMLYKRACIGKGTNIKLP